MSPSWQYDSVICGNNLELDRRLNTYGKFGWEAYAVIHKEYPSGDEVYIAYLKRKEL